MSQVGPDPSLEYFSLSSACKHLAELFLFADGSKALAHLARHIMRRIVATTSASVAAHGA